MNSLQDTPSQKVVPGDIWTYGKEERRKLILEISESIISSFTDFTFRGMTRTSNDHDLFQEPSIQLLSLGMFYLHYQDAIKEGDVERVLTYIMEEYATYLYSYREKKLC